MRRILLFALAWLMLVASPRAQTGKNPEMQALVDAFVAAWNKGDAKALAALHAEGAIRASPQGQMLVGRAAIEQSFAAAFAAELKGTKLVVTPGDERSISPDMAVSNGTWEITGGTPPAGAATKGTYLNVVVRQGGRWLVASSAPYPAAMKP
jgi:uncharacterized protein (TIGR02246 family)